MDNAPIKLLLVGWRGPSGPVLVARPRLWQAALTFRPDVVAFRPGHDGFFVLDEEARVFTGTCYDAASSAGGGARAEQGLLGLL